MTELEKYKKRIEELEIQNEYLENVGREFLDSCIKLDLELKKQQELFKLKTLEKPPSKIEGMRDITFKYPEDLPIVINDLKNLKY